MSIVTVAPYCLACIVGEPHRGAEWLQGPCRAPTTTDQCGPACNPHHGGIPPARCGPGVSRSGSSTGALLSNAFIRFGEVGGRKPAHWPARRSGSKGCKDGKDCIVRCHYLDGFSLPLRVEAPAIATGTLGLGRAGWPSSPPERRPVRSGRADDTHDAPGRLRAAGPPGPAGRDGCPHAGVAGRPGRHRAARSHPPPALRCPSLPGPTTGRSGFRSSAPTSRQTVATRSLRPLGCPGRPPATGHDPTGPRSPEGGDHDPGR
jgi:hypothetical protein